jgi:hypothetical protein
VKNRNETQDPLIEFLTEFAKYLLAAGVSVSRFEGSAQLAFLLAASKQSRFRNCKVNRSAVAAMTGLTRTQVRNLLRTNAHSVIHRESRIDRIVTGWISDPLFTTTAGNARALPIHGRVRSFTVLAKKYGGDVTPRALQSELLRQGLIRLKGDRVTLSNKARRTKDPIQLDRLASALAKVLGQSEPNASVRPLKFLTAHVTYETPIAAGRILLQRRLNQGLKAFATDVQSAGSAIAKTSRRNKTTRRMSRTSFLLVSQD